MENEKAPMLIDVEKVLYVKNPKLARYLPGFVASYLKRIVHQDDITISLRITVTCAARIQSGTWVYNKVPLTVLKSSFADGIFVSNHLSRPDGMVFEEFPNTIAIKSPSMTSSVH
jgi:hypothetical protein